MKSFFYYKLWFLILFFLLISFPCLAEETPIFSVNLASDATTIVNPKSFVKPIFSLNNLTNKEQTFNLLLVLPMGWQTVSTLEKSITIPPHTEKKIPISILVPIAIFPDTSYSIKLIASLQKDPNYLKEASANFSVKSIANIKIIAPENISPKKAGNFLDYTFTVVNLGNSKDSIAIFATSAHGEQMSISADTLDLEPGEQKDVIITTKIPEFVSPYTNHAIIFIAQSLKSDKNFSVKTTVLTPIIDGGKLPQLDTLNKIFPSELTLYTSGLGSGQPITTQAKFYTQGNFEKNTWMNFNYEGPYHTDKINSPYIPQERWTLNYGAPNWDTSMGDLNIPLSDLTINNISARGGRFGMNNNFFNAMAFKTEDPRAGMNNKTFTGATVSKNIMPSLQMDVRCVRLEETDAPTTPYSETSDILSVSSTHRLQNFFLTNELGKSSIDMSDGYEQKPYAWRSKSHVLLNKLFIDGEFTDSGAGYPGTITNQRGYRGFMQYNLTRISSLWLRNTRILNNTNNDATKIRTENYWTEVGTSINPSHFPSLSLSYLTNTTETFQSVLLNKIEEDSINLMAFKSFGPFSINTLSKYGKREAILNDTYSDFYQYSLRLYHYGKKLRPWIGYGEDHADIDSNFKEIGADYYFSSYLNASANFKRENSDEEPSKDYINLDLCFDPSRDIRFTAEGQMQELADNTKEWIFWLSLLKRFDILIPWVKDKSRIFGIVYFDDNSNGIKDPNEKGLSKVKLFLTPLEKITSSNGSYSFSPLAPGKYSLNVDLRSLPFGFAPSIVMPLTLELIKGKALKQNIPIVKTGKIKGMVYIDTNKNQQKDEEELGLPLVQISLIKNSKIIQKGFSDSKGHYVLNTVVPGNYDLTLDKNWLPKRFILTTPSPISITVLPGQELTELNFGAVEKERPIKKTFKQETTITPVIKAERWYSKTTKKALSWLKIYYMHLINKDPTPWYSHVNNKTSPWIKSHVVPVIKNRKPAWYFYVKDKIFSYKKKADSKE